MLTPLFINCKQSFYIQEFTNTSKKKNKIKQIERGYTLLFYINETPNHRHEGKLQFQTLFLFLTEDRYGITNGNKEVNSRCCTDGCFWSNCWSQHRDNRSLAVCNLQEITVTDFSSSK